MSASRTIAVLTLIAAGVAPAWADTPRAASEAPKKDRSQRVGEIFIIGNKFTLDSCILRQIPFKPGDKFTLTDLRAAQRNLERLQIFKKDPPPEIRILDREGDAVYKDIVIEVYDRDCNVYFWAGHETLEFVYRWVQWGLIDAIAHAPGDAFPLELICFALPGGREYPPIALQYLLYDLGLSK